MIASLSSAIKNDESNESNRTTFTHLFTNKRTLKYLLIMAANWVGVNVVWYGLVMAVTFLWTNL